MTNTAANQPPPMGGDDRPPEFKSVVDEAWRRASDTLRPLIAKSTCFGHLWQDNTGPCPEAPHCDIAQQCERVYLQVREPKPVVPPEPAPAARPPTLSDPGAPKPRRRGRPPKVLRGKWKDTGKYQRLGYQNVGRPVDQALAHFIQALGSPAALPKVWSPIHFEKKYAALGRLVISQTASYTSVIIDGNTVVRFWTNAGNCALIDVVPELFKVVQTIKGTGSVYQVPAGCEKKLRPCSHRFELTFGASLCEDVLTMLAGVVKMAYRVDQDI